VPDLIICLPRTRISSRRLSRARNKRITNPAISLVRLRNSRFGSSVSNYSGFKFQVSSLRRHRVSRGAALPRLDDLSDRFLQALGDVPSRVVGFHLPQVAVVADVVADAVFVNVGVLLGLAGESLCDLKGLKDGAAIISTSTEVINLSNPWCLHKGGHEAGDVEGVDVVADLFTHVAKDSVFLALEVALHEVAEEPVELDAGVIGPGEASAAKAAGGHAEVAAVFLDDDIRRDLGGPEDGVLALVDGEVLGDTVRVGGIGIVPAGLEFLQRNGVGTVTVDLIRRHVNEGCLGEGAAGSLEHIEGADGVRIEVVEWDGGRAVVAGLGGGVDDGVGLDLGNQVEDTLSVADVELVMDEALEIFLEALLIPAGVSLRTKENGALVVIDAVDLVSELA
jgi:hypothetical protein